MTEKSSAGQPVRNFSRVAAAVEARLSGNIRLAAEDRDQEWQRVNSYVADVLKDAHVLYAKIARLQGDFTGSELGHLEKIGERVLDLGEELSKFMKAFHEGQFNMADAVQFGGPSGAPPGTPPPAIPSEFKEGEKGEKGEGAGKTEEEYEKEIRNEEGGEFEEFEEEKGGEA